MAYHCFVFVYFYIQINTSNGGIIILSPYKAFKAVDFVKRFHNKYNVNVINNNSHAYISEWARLIVKRMFRYLFGFKVPIFNEFHTFYDRKGQDFNYEVSIK